MDQTNATGAKGPLSPQELMGPRVEKVRQARGMTRDDLADKLQEMGLDWTRLTVNRLEIGRRQNVTVTELLALCAALHISPTDLLVPAYLEHESYRVAPKASASASNLREWIRGEQVLFLFLDPEPDAIFASPSLPKDIAAFVQWMPEDRAKRVVQDYYRPDPDFEEGPE
jgi:transcriptional regulator with XRE-family HTH domain